MDERLNTVFHFIFSCFSHNIFDRNESFRIFDLYVERKIVRES